MSRIKGWWNRGKPCIHAERKRLHMIIMNPDLYDSELPANDVNHICDVCGKRYNEFVLKMEIRRKYKIERNR